ncbi:FecR domain-containing protein [Cohnella boryungensis]|uniref:FecR domain-containing protein n=1 Tax=Cohnella boryungensis TaxID=768479 RepID=A0ABV8S3U9_9BACL
MNRRLLHLTLFILLFSLLTPISSLSAASKPSANAVIVSVTGKASITPRGGANAFRAFPGMPLRQGDTITTGEEGSVTLKIASPESVRTLGPNSQATLSRLDAGSRFMMTMRSGSVWSSVKPVAGAVEDAIEAPGIKLNVRGTNFLVLVDPNGRVYIAVASGLVSATVTEPSAAASDVHSVLLAPSQQMNLNLSSLPANLQDSVSVIDVDALVEQTDLPLHKAILLSAPSITQENTNFIESLQRALNAGQPAVIDRDGTASDLSIPDASELDKVSRNLQYLVSHIARASLQAYPAEAGQLTRLIEEVNAQIPGTVKDIALNETNAIDPLAGISDAGFRAKEKEQARLDALQLQAQQNHNQLQKTFQELIAQLKQSNQRLAEENRSVLDEFQREAEDLYVRQLSPQELAAYQAAKQQPQSNEGNAGTSTAPSSTSEPTNPAPAVALRKIDTATGFNLDLQLSNFTGTKAVYAAEFHFISGSAIQAGSANVRLLNDRYFSAATSTDAIQSIEGTLGSAPEPMTETIYAATNFGAAAPVSISNGVFATLPFTASSSGTLRLFYVKVVDRTGATLLELTDGSSQLPAPILYTKP